MTGEIDEQTDWGKALDGIDVVIHLAARVYVMDDLAADPLREWDGYLRLDDRDD